MTLMNAAILNRFTKCPKKYLTRWITCAKILFCSVRNRNTHLTAGVVQLVERLLAKEKVVSSSLIARSFPD